MSRNIRIHKVFPTNKRATIGENSNIDFDLTFPMRKLVCNSIRVEGRVKVYKTGTTRANLADNIFVDNMIGANAFFQTYETSSQNRGVLEFAQEMPRCMKMTATGFNTRDDMVNLANSCELRSQNLALSQALFFGEVNEDMVLTPHTANTTDGQSFSIKPYFLLNQTSRGQEGGDVNLRNQTLGDLKISIRTARNNDALFGTDADGSVYYELSDVALTFHSLPDDGKQDKLVMRTKSVVRQSIQSGLGVISVNAPLLSNGVSISFLEQSKQNANNHNSLQLDRLRNVSKVEFLINNSLSDYLTYQLTNENQILEYYLQSLSNSDMNSYGTSYIKANEAYGVGQNFGGLVDVSQNTFGANITSKITSPYVCFIFFHGMITV
jgi:hypothetical protein